MNEDRLFADLHVIQTLPPSNVNRDDTGSPKSAVYGGVRRARVSSQSWKRAMRKYFLDNSELELGVRSLNIGEYVAEKISKLDSTINMDQAIKMADKVLNLAKVKSKDGKVKALFFLGEKQAEKLAAAAVNGVEDKGQINSILNANPAIDIALFGRMVADDPSLNEDASAQVAHAISTHAVQSEFDYFTAVDDLAASDNAGAGMLGTIEYNSSTLYRYANIAIHELSKQIGDKEATINAVKLFAEAFANSMPTGKINTFANQTIPQMIIINLRRDRPVNLVSAFESPVRANHGYVGPSIEALCQELGRVQKFVKEPVCTLYLTADGVGKAIDGQQEDNLTIMLNDLGNALERCL